MTPPRKCSGPDGRGIGLPLDALYEILLRLPAKELCRLRAVCRPWRSLLSDPHFIANHAARHPGLLIVAVCHPMHEDSSRLFDILDLSGREIKRFHKVGGWQSNEWVTCDQLDIVCIKKGIRRDCILLNPATGSMFALPEGYAEEHAVQARDSCNFRHLVSFGQVVSTGQYKVLRVIDSLSYEEQLCEIFTFDMSSHARWRGKRPVPGHVTLRGWSSIVIKGIVYFLLGKAARDRGPIRIASFDLGTEDWRTTLRGPMNSSHIDYDDLSLISLNNCLVVMHSVRFHGSTMDLWFLMDFEKGLWVKQYSIQHKLSFQQDEFSVRPLFMLNDGRILTYIGTRGLLRIYNPRTSNFTDVADIGLRGEVCLYTGNLLSLESDAS